MTANAGNKKFPNLTKSRCRQDTFSTSSAYFCKEVLRTLHLHWNKKEVCTLGKFELSEFYVSGI